MNEQIKPLGRKNYGSIGHIASSRLGPGDYQIHIGQSEICTTKAKGHTVYVQTKVDGSNVGVAKLEDERIVALTRKGHEAITSPFELHHFFHYWVQDNINLFDYLLNPGERVCGEWLAQAHGTLYDLSERSPFVAFDIMRESNRLCYNEFINRIDDIFTTPFTISGPIDPLEAMPLMDHYGAEEPEGLIYRAEKDNKVSFIGKWVQPNKVDGKYLIDHEPVWNWDCSQFIKENLND